MKALIETKNATIYRRIGLVSGYMVATGCVIALGLSTGLAEETAANLGSVAETITSNLGQVTKLITALSYVAGIAFTLSGLVKFKAHKNNPTQVPLSAPIVLVVIGACLLFLPSILTMAGGTLFSGGGDASSSGGVDPFSSAD